MSITLNVSTLFNEATAPSGANPISVIITAESGGSFFLSWNDGIEGWEECYGSLAVVLARLAALAECGESGWSASFAHTEDEFTEVAADWLNTVAP